MNRNYYLHKLTKYPPHITAYKILRKIAVKLKVEAESLKANLFSTYISDKQLLESLVGSFENIDELLKHIEERIHPNFFLQPSDRSKMVDIVKSHYPNVITQTIADADKICEHVFNILGSGDVHLGKKIDWHTDFKTDWRWKPKYYKKVDYGDLNNPYDVKVPWELSRCQHFVTLGKAYWFVKEHEVQGAKCEVKEPEKYAREFVNQVSDWIDSNPPKLGVNWVCTMDVAIRVVNWIWGYYFFKDSPCLTDEFLLKFLKNILVHGRHIMNNLENKGKITSNHYLSDIVGLVYLGVMFPEFKEARKWWEFGIQGLISEMDKQVYPDGVDYEASVSYHRLVTELFLSATLLAVINEQSDPDSGILERWKNQTLFPAWYMERIEKMFEFVMYYTKPDGATPQVGDNDDGRLHILSNYGNWNRLDHRYLLSIGAVLFNRSDFKKAAGEFHEEAFWLLGKEGLDKFNSIPDTDKELLSKAFPNGGIYIMRHKDLYMIVDCIPNNSEAPSSHIHNSRLSFELFAYDKTFIVDPGAYIYTANAEWRNKFRSTAYHNTVVVDEEEQNDFDPYDLFRLGMNAEVKVNEWKVTAEYGFLDAQHSRYERLYEPIIHRRQIWFNKKEGYWVIKDTLSKNSKSDVFALKSNIEHRFDLYFHFAPMKLIVDEESPLAVRTNFADSANITIMPMETEGLKISVEDGWISYSYGTKVEAPVVKYSKGANVPVDLVIVLYPYDGLQPLFSLKEIKEYALEFIGGTL